MRYAKLTIYYIVCSFAFLLAAIVDAVMSFEQWFLRWLVDVDAWAKKE